MSHGSEGWLFLGIGLYLIALLVVAFITWRRMRSLDDFVLGGRNLSPFSAALSERASGESGWFLLGLPGTAYVAGFAEFWTVIGSSFGIFFSWTLLAKLLNSESRRLGALTIPDFLEAKLGDDTRQIRIVATAIILFFYTSYVAAQFNAAGVLLEATFGLAQSSGVLIGAAIVVIYTFMGGFLAVVWTDVVQGLLMALVAVVLPILGFFALGGPGGFVEAITARGPDSFAGMSAEDLGRMTFGFDLVRMNAGKVGWGLVNGVVLGGLMWGLGYLGQPHLLARFMAIRKSSEVRQGHTVAITWVLLAYWGAAFVGIMAIALLPDVEYAQREQVMPLLALKLLPAWIAGLAIAGGIAAMMSTADSQLLVATSALVEDVYVRIFKPSVDAARLVLLSRLATVTIAAISLVLAFRTKEFIFTAVEYAWTGLGSSFAPVLLLALRWKRLTKPGALSGMIGGMLSTVAWKNVEGLDELLDIKLATFLIALGLAVGVSLVSPPPAARARS